jgi:type IV pilus assembly protein PilE
LEIDGEPRRQTGISPKKYIIRRTEADMLYRTESSPAFTLVELLVVMAIAAILATVGFPSYRAHILHTNRSAAQQFLIDLANREQQYLMDARSYGTLAQLGVTVPSAVSTRYNIDVTVDNTATPPSFVLAATPRSDSVQMADGPLTLNGTGAKTPAEKWK